jgi:hypothetical protein
LVFRILANAKSLLACRSQSCADPAFGASDGIDFLSSAQDLSVNEARVVSVSVEHGFSDNHEIARHRPVADLHVQTVSEILWMLVLRNHDQEVKIAVFLDTSSGGGAKEDDTSRLGKFDNLVHNLANILS